MISAEMPLIPPLKAVLIVVQIPEKKPEIAAQFL